MPECQISQKLLQIQSHLCTTQITNEGWAETAEALKDIVEKLAWSSSPVGPAQHNPKEAQEQPAPSAEVAVVFPQLLPQNHTAVLIFIQTVMQDVKQKNEELYKTLKFVPKKNGLNPLMSKVADGIWPIMMDDRALMVAYYSIERSFAELVLVTMTYLLLLPDMREGFLAPLRDICERVPVRERHSMLLIYTRGFFTPGDGMFASCSNSGVYEVIRTYMYRPMYFYEPITEGNAHQASIVTFPFLEIPALWALRERYGDQHSFFDTGVIDILRRLEVIDTQGSVIKALRKWAGNFLMGNFVNSMQEREVEQIQQNPVALEITQTHKFFFNSQKHHRKQWRAKVEELGRIICLMADCARNKTLSDDDFVSSINQAMFATSFLARLRPGTNVKKGYERIACDPAGKILSFRLGWPDLKQVLDQGLASMLNTTEEQVSGKVFQESLTHMMKDWQQPHLLADYYQFHRKDREVGPLFLRFLRSILKLSPETYQDIRFNDEHNHIHLSHVNLNALEIWKNENVLPGTYDKEFIFRIGEDTRSCMAIRQSCSGQNRALLGYLLQGNTRFLVVKSKEDKVAGRAVLRLLLRNDNKEPVLFMDKVYASGMVSENLREELWEQAKAVSHKLQIPVYQTGEFIEPAGPSDIYTKEITGYDYEAVELIELDGVSPWVYSDGAKEVKDGEAMQRRHEGKRQLTLAVLKVFRQ